MLSPTILRALACAFSILSAAPQGNAAAVPALTGCGKALPSGQSPSSFHNVTIWSGDFERRFVVFIPPAYDTQSPSQLILSFHGGTKTAEKQIDLDRLTSSEFNTQSIVVYPQGYNVWAISLSSSLPLFSFRLDTHQAIEYMARHPRSHHG